MFKDIKRLESEETRFCFLIGAGASRSSGIKTGWELSEEWHQDLKEDLDEEEFLKWKNEIELDEENIGAYYPQLYQKRYEVSPEIGYEEFKKLMENIDPGIGYVILAQILAEERHNFVITTNFDYLIEDSVRLYTATKPFSAGHETLAEFISSQTERPTIIKVHRDLFLHPFNDDKETQKLKEEWERALKPILRNFNLLVIGYGGNDGSLMDYLSNIHAQERKAVYWCIRNEKELNHKINGLLDSKDCVVTIDGFDELMLDLGGALRYEMFDNLDETEGHPFVMSAKRRISGLYEMRKALLERLAKNKQGITKETKELFTGAYKYIIDAVSESNPEDADRIFQEGMRNYPNDATLLGQYALFNFELGNSEQAEEFYQKALEIAPDDPDILGNYAIYLRSDVGDDDKTEEYFKKALELKPDQANNLNNYANFLREVREDYDLAEEYYKRAIRLDPHYGLFLSNYANFLLHNRKKLKQAEEYYQRAMDADPNDVGYLGSYALFLLEYKKDFDRAEEYFIRALELAPNDANYLANYAHLLIIVKQDFAGAEPLIDKSLEHSKPTELALLAELWYYRYAHYKKWLKQGEKELQKLVEAEAKSIDWNFGDHIKIAKKNKHPNVPKLEEFATLISSE